MFPKDTRVLILDDMPGMRQIVKGLMRNLGFTSIVEADNGKTGLELAEQAASSGTPFGLILSDWNMPIVTGIEVLEKLRQHKTYQNVPFLLVTAEGEFKQVKRAMSLRVSDYIVKPFSPAAFQAKLESCWKKHRPKP